MRGNQVSRKGFSLVELMVGMTLAAMVFAGAFRGMKTGFDITAEARSQVRVTQLLQSEIERLRTLNWADVSELPEKEAVEFEGALEGAYRNNYQFTRVVDSAGNNRVSITVIANWESSGRDRELSMMTLITKDGLYDYYYRTF